MWTVKNKRKSWYLKVCFLFNIGFCWPKINKNVSQKKALFSALLAAAGLARLGVGGIWLQLITPEYSFLLCLFSAYFPLSAERTHSECETKLTMRLLFLFPWWVRWVGWGGLGWLDLLLKSGHCALSTLLPSIHSLSIDIYRIYRYIDINRFYIYLYIYRYTYQ